jgi:hypothetical protein
MATVDWLVHVRPIPCRKSAADETSRQLGSLAAQMKFERDNVKATELNLMDRRIIRVDVPPAHAGITAALRRALEAAASEPCERDFAELLRKLN